MRVMFYASPEYDQFVADLEKRRHDSSHAARTVAAKVIEEVRRDGDSAVSRILRDIDRVIIAPEKLLIAPALSEIDPDLVEAIDLAIERITRFHENQLTNGYTTDDGQLSMRLRPLRRAGIYVPGGRAVYLSSLLMCAIPAKLAGVAELVVATTPSAAAAPELQYVARRLGVREIYAAGGPAGIAAMALGTQSLRRVDKIVGPGNQYVTAAKELLYGTVGIDMTAGPTEIVLIVDETTDVRLAAADLLAQAEHGDDSTAICVTASSRLAAEIVDEVERQLLTDGRESAASNSMRANGAVIIVPRLDCAPDVVNQLGPEHVSIQSEAVDVDAIENCGAVFVGRYSPVAIGDYVAGTNHVLPTAGAARFFSPLGVYDFVKRSTVVRLDEAAFGEIAEAGERLAAFEGLPLHARSIAARFESAEELRDISGGAA